MRQRDYNGDYELWRGFYLRETPVLVKVWSLANEGAEGASSAVLYTVHTVTTCGLCDTASVRCHVWWCARTHHRACLQRHGTDEQARAHAPVHCPVLGILPATG